MNNSVSYLTLFKTFMKIGIVTFGGGYAMIPIIESEVVDKHHWMTKEEFLDAIATTQVCPGALAINMSSLLGYKLAKTPGAIVCTLGASLPSFLIILAIAMFFHQFEDNKVVAAMFAGIRPAVVALIAVPTFSLAKSAQYFACQLLDSYPVRPSDLAFGRQPYLGDYRSCRRWLHLWTVYPANGVN